MAVTQPKTSGADHNVMRELNRSLVVDILKQRSPISRAAIAKTVGLAKPTVSAIVDDLIAENLVNEIGVGKTTTGGGRPPILLQFNSRSQLVVGVRIGIHLTDILVADARGEEIARRQLATTKARPNVFLRKLAETITSTLAEEHLPPKALAAIGVCVPGLTDSVKGVLLLAPNLGWRNVPVAGVLNEMLGVPVFVHNTAQAAVVAEALLADGNRMTDLVILYVSTGIGAGVISDGRLFHGRRGIASEVGHCRVPTATGRCNCGKIGCLETVASGPAIAAAAQRALDARRASSLNSVEGELTAEDVARAATDGDPLALEVLASAGRELGIAASWLVNLFDPAVLVVIGGVANAGEPLLGPLSQAVHEHALPQCAQNLTIRASAVGDDIEIRGSVLLALQQSETFYRVIFQA